MARKLKSDPNLPGEFSIIGISSIIKDYRLCHFLNKDLKLGLERKSDFIFSSSADADIQQYAIFYSYEEQYNQEYFLVNNKTVNGILFSQHRNVDMFLLIRGNISPAFLRKLQKQIQQLQQVQLAAEVKTEGIKNIDFILQEIEIYSIGFKPKNSKSI